MRIARAGWLAVAAAMLPLAAFAAKPAKGELPPEFTATALNGRKISISWFRDKHPVVLEFYAKFCPTCPKMLAHLRELDEKYSTKGLRLVAVSMDEDRQTGAALASQAGVKFPVIYDAKGTIAEKYGVQALPHTVVVGKDGKIQAVVVGFDLDTLDRAVEQAL